MERTRFDIPLPIVGLLDMAIACKVIDTADVIALVLTHGDNWSALRRAVVEIAFSNFHDPRGREAHAQVAREADICALAGF
jgi:hypothetical protein